MSQRPPIASRKDPPPEALAATLAEGVPDPSQYVYHQFVSAGHYPVQARQVTATVLVPVHNGSQHAHPGDWIVLTRSGTSLVLPHNVFAVLFFRKDVST